MPVNEVVVMGFFLFFLSEVVAMGRHNDATPWGSVEIRQTFLTCDEDFF
jgi:hypothetical protein